MTKLIPKYTTKLMTTIQAINDQTKYSHIFSHVTTDQKLATCDHQVKTGHLHAYFGHFFGVIFQLHIIYLGLTT